MYYLILFLPLLINDFLVVDIPYEILYAYSFLVNFVLFYYLCGRDGAIQEKPASTVISLLFGGFVGTWVGGLTATFLLPVLGMKDFRFTSGLSMLPNVMQQNLLFDIVLAVATMLSLWFVLQWDEKLIEAGFESRTEAPPDIILVSALYVVSGILSLCVLPLLNIIPSFGNELWSLWLIVTLIPLVAVNAAAQIIIAVSIYKGKRWGWLIAFAASLIGVCFNAVSLTIYGFQLLLLAGFSNLILLTATVIALALNIITIIFLLTSSSRHHCKIVNPAKPSS
jgi:hypothetical protein